MANMEWQPIETAPETAWGDRGTDALLYSPEFGVKAGDIGNYGDGPRAHAGGYHGCAVRDWGVTHWMPLPAPPEVLRGAR
jgi:hypothetical protein